MATNSRPTSRLNTLPIEVLRKIFDLVEPGHNEYAFHKIDGGYRDMHIRSGNTRVMRKLADDPLSSDLVRRVALEQSYHDVHCLLAEHVRLAVKDLRENPTLGRCVRMLNLMCVNVQDAEEEEDVSNMNSRHFSLRDIAGESILTLLETMPGLEFLKSNSEGVARLPVGKERQSILKLNRLNRLYLEEGHGGNPDQPVLDLDGAIMQSAPNLRRLGMRGICHVIASEGTCNKAGSSQNPDIRLKQLTWLGMQDNEMSLASLRLLMSNIGPGLQSAEFKIPSRSLRPSDHPDSSHRFGLYDLLVALSPWRETSLQRLILTPRLIWESDMGDNIEGQPGPSVMPLFSSFTALRIAGLFYELFDWRGAGDYLSGYRESQESHDEEDTEKNEGTKEAASRLAQTASRIIDQLPSGLQVLHISIIPQKSRHYEAAWGPRRLAFATAFLAAVDAGKFPRLHHAQINDYFRSMVKYEWRDGANVACHADCTENGCKVRLRGEFIEEICDGLTIDVYEGVTPELAERYQEVLRPVHSFSP